MDAETHFNAIAQEYDYWKKKNSYYHSAIKQLLRSKIPEGSSVLEIGCGTGDILASLAPVKGMGIDISSAMIERAREKYPQHTFFAQDIRTVPEAYPHDFAVLVDVLEHVENVPEFLNHISRITKSDVSMLITLANPAWEPILEIAEKLGLKMPEGPHYRMSIADTEVSFIKNGFSIVEKGHRLLIPKKIPGSDWMNKYFYKIPLLAPLGVIQYWILKKQPVR